MTEESIRFYEKDFQSVITAACLCHDIGNPPFGHSGEDSIAEYFRQKFEYDEKFKNKFSKQKQLDLMNFEGNSNSIRCLVQSQVGKTPNGLDLTCSTLSAIIKYPCPSSKIDQNKKDLKRKKFGYLQSEKDIFFKIAENTGMLRDKKYEGTFYRHPFTWIIEAADDICYNVIDLEDAHRLKIINFKKCSKLLFGLIEDLKTYITTDDFEKIQLKYSIDGNGIDENDMIAYLRAKAINTLIIATFEKYKDNFERILDGTLNTSLYDLLKEESPRLKEINKFSKEKIYEHPTVVKVKNAGYNVMYELLDHFIEPILKDENALSAYDKTKLKLLPKQFKTKDKSPYLKTLGIVDYVSGMTDNYASELYRKIKGIDMDLAD